MRTNFDPKLQALLADMTRARELTELEQYEEARAIYLKVRADCVRGGIRSAHAAWGLAVTSDGLGEFAPAMEYIHEALELDPLAIPYQRSYDVIVGRIRATLSDEARNAADPSTPRLYELLTRVGETDAGSHLAMARYLHHTGDHAGAMKLLDALTTLTPSYRSAWMYKAVVARAMGDQAAATNAEIEAAALGGREALPFAVLAQARS